MKFELSVALKYLIPRWRQLSVSIISLISILVVSLVVWLAIVFLSISEGIQERWIEGFVTLNAPVKVTPTEAYFRSYYHQIDRYSFASSYAPKSISEKRKADKTDPYDPLIDRELPHSLIPPDGEMKDLVKEAWEAISSLQFDGIRPHEAEVSLCNLKLQVGDAFLSQLCYVSGHDENNARMKKRIIPPSNRDLSNFAASIPGDKNLFFNAIDLRRVQTADYDFFLSSELISQRGELLGCKISSPFGEEKVIIPLNERELGPLMRALASSGWQVERVQLSCEKGHLDAACAVALAPETPLEARVIDAATGRLQVKGVIQGMPIVGDVPSDHLEILDASLLPKEGYWVYENGSGVSIPSDVHLGDGILLSSSYREKGVRLGDRGYISFMSGTSTSVQEQKSPIYVAGFFDPGIVPMASKLLFVSPQMMRAFDGNLSLPDQMFANGINVWLDHPADAQKVKKALQEEFERRGIAPYWQVESFYDYEFARPILQQFDSDKTLFTLVAIMILVVACSNIISMLLLLVNDKKREIGILQSLGASPKRIGMIFGMCGLFTGLASCLFGTLLALLTLKNLTPLVRFLNLLKGHELFQKMFFGGDLPNSVSMGALLFVVLTTVVISVLAGLIPALKAAQIRPSETLRREG